MMPERRHGVFSRELTETTIDSFFERRGIYDIPYSYVVHHRDTTDDKQPGRANPHSHVILPGTYYSWADGTELPLYMNRDKKDNHIGLLYQIAQTQIDVLLQLYVGLDWETSYDLLKADREQLKVLAQQSEASRIWM